MATSSPPAVSAADSSAVRELAQSLKARVGTVSYTHLDVYKRQV